MNLVEQDTAVGLYLVRFKAEHRTATVTEEEKLNNPVFLEGELIDQSRNVGDHSLIAGLTHLKGVGDLLAFAYILN